jgi:hypothetical protein
VDEGEITKQHHLGGTRHEGEDLNRKTGKHSTGSLGGGEEVEKSRIAHCYHYHAQGGVRNDLLDEGQVGAMGRKQGRQTGKIFHMILLMQRRERRDPGASLSSLIVIASFLTGIRDVQSAPFD